MARGRLVVRADGPSGFHATKLTYQRRAVSVTVANSTCAAPASRRLASLAARFLVRATPMRGEVAKTGRGPTPAPGGTSTRHRATGTRAATPGVASWWLLAQPISLSTERRGPTSLRTGRPKERRRPRRLLAVEGLLCERRQVHLGVAHLEPPELAEQPHHPPAVVYLATLKSQLGSGRGGVVVGVEALAPGK